MTEFLGNAASGQLLVLMAFPIIGAIIFAIIIAVSLSRRRKKNQMKLGIQPKKARPKEAPPDEKKSDLDTGILASLFPTQESQTNPSSEKVRPPGSSDNPAGPFPRPSPNLTNPRRETDMFAQESSKPFDEAEEIDLAGRLGQLSPEPQNPPPQPTPSANPQNPPPQPTPSANPAELLRLLRHPQTGQLIVEVGGRQYTKLTDIDEKEVGQYIFKLAAHLLTFTNGMVATDVGLKSVYNPRLEKAPAPITAASASPSTPPGPRPPKPMSVPSQPVSTPDPRPEPEADLLASLQQPAPVEQPSSRGGLFGRSRSGPEPTLPGLNLADEINKIVQARLLASPLAATTELEITSNIGGGIRIRVNDQIYSGPDEIPDLEVKNLIKAAIKQWERS